MYDKRSHVLEVGRPNGRLASMHHSSTCISHECPYEGLDVSGLDAGTYKVTGGLDSPEFEEIEGEPRENSEPGIPDQETPYSIFRRDL